MYHSIPFHSIAERLFLTDSIPHRLYSSQAPPFLIDFYLSYVVSATAAYIRNSSHSHHQYHYLHNNHLHTSSLTTLDSDKTPKLIIFISGSRKKQNCNLSSISCRQKLITIYH